MPTLGRPAYWLLLPLALVATMPGCGGAIRGAAGDIVQDAPGRVAEGSLGVLEAEETQDRLIALLESPELQDATRALVASLLDGTLDALGAEERAARLARATDTFVGAISVSVGDAIDREIGPALARTVARTLEASLASATSEASLERVGVVVGQLAREAVAAMVTALREELGPAMRDALREALSDEATRQALADSARALSAAIVLGVQDGLQEIRARGELEEEPDTLVDRFGQLAHGGRDLVEIAVVLMGLGLVVIALWLLRAVNEQRRQAAEASKREAAILAMAATLRGGGTPPEEIVEYIRRSFEASSEPRRRGLARHARPPETPPAGGTPQPT